MGGLLGEEICGWVDLEENGCFVFWWVEGVEDRMRKLGWRIGG